MPFVLPTFDAGDYKTLYPIAPIQGNGDSYINVNSATMKTGCVFRAEYSEALNSCIFGLELNNGTPGANLTMELFAVDDDGYPTGTALAAETGLTPTSSSWNTFAFSTPATLTAGTVYAVVLSNTHGTPASNYFRLGIDIGSNRRPLLSGWAPMVHYNGTSWQNDDSWRADVLFRPVYATSTATVQMMGVSATATAGPALYDAARYGVQIYPPHAMQLQAFSVRLGAKQGTFTEPLIGEICSASAVLATSQNSVLTDANNVMGTLWFATAYTLSAATNYYIVVRPETNTAGDGSNYARILSTKYLEQTASYGLFRAPVTSTAESPSFSNVTTYLPMITLHVKDDWPSGGGGLLTHPGMGGGLNG